MPQIYEKLIENSLAAVLSSIEIYNKPDFKYREEVFTILNINAWELLLKAKILKDENDKLESLYVADRNGGYKKSRNGTPLTIEIIGAMNKVNLDQIVANNVRTLVEIRDTVIHFYSEKSLSYILYTLGAASLQNYQKIIKTWFDKSLTDYNFYILPLGFMYNFQTLSLIDLKKEPEAISNLVRSIIDLQSTTNHQDDFYFVCEVTTRVRKLDVVTSTDLSMAIDPNAKEGLLIERLVSLTDQYPFSYSELAERVKKICPNVKQQLINKIIRDHNIKENPKMSAYNFRTNTSKEQFRKTGSLPTNTPSLYNDNAVRFIATEFQKISDLKSIPTFVKEPILVS